MSPEWSVQFRGSEDGDCSTSRCRQRHRETGNGCRSASPRGALDVSSASHFTRSDAIFRYGGSKNDLAREVRRINLATTRKWSQVLESGTRVPILQTLGSEQAQPARSASSSGSAHVASARKSAGFARRIQILVATCTRARSSRKCRTSTGLTSRGLISSLSGSPLTGMTHVSGSPLTGMTHET